MIAPRGSETFSLNLAARAQQSPMERIAGSGNAPSIWQQVNTPNPGQNNILFSLSADSENDIWSVGNFVSLHFDGQSWNAVPLVMFQGKGEFESTMNAVTAVSPTDAWEVGDTLENIVPPGNGHFVGVIEHFDGTQWNIIPSPQLDSGVELHAIQAVSANDIFAVGDSNADSQLPSPFLEHYDGTSWSVVALPPLGNGQNGSVSWHRDPLRYRYLAHR
jgi:hypothetical protein